MSGSEQNSSTKAKAEARRQRILAASGERMGVVSGGTEGSSTASAGGMSKYAAARKRRYGKKKAVAATPAVTVETTSQLNQLNWSNRVEQDRTGFSPLPGRQQVRNEREMPMRHPNIPHYDPTPSTLCRVLGLTSDEGKKKNGSVGHVNLSKGFGAGADVRHPVCLDGFKGPMSIKRSNLEVFSEEDACGAIMVAIGRKKFFDSRYCAIMRRNDRELEQTLVGSSRTARTEGNLKAIEMVVKNHRHECGAGPIIFNLSDLNLARAFNRAALGEEVGLAAPLNKKFQRIKRMFPKDGRQKVMAKYDPHRLWPDKFYTKLEKFGTQRYEASKLGTYQIYPSSHPENLDALEVLYADGSGKRQDVIIRQELYIDYGVEEAIMYARHAFAMNETSRLHPEVLAGVDPHAFWSAILWIERFITTLKNLQLDPDLLDEWKSIEMGRKKSTEYFKSSMKISRFDPELLMRPEEKWGIAANEEHHMKTATAYSICAVEAMHKSLRGRKGISSVTVITLGQFKGTEMWRYIRGTTMFKEIKDEREKETGREMRADASIALYRQCMEMLGFVKGSKFWKGPAFLDLSKTETAFERGERVKIQNAPDRVKNMEAINWIVDNFLRILMVPILGTDYDSPSMWNVLYKEGARQRIHNHMVQSFIGYFWKHPQYQSKDAVERLVGFKWGSGAKYFSQEPIFRPMQEELYQYLKKEEMAYDSD